MRHVLSGHVGQKPWVALWQCLDQVEVQIQLPRLADGGLLQGESGTAIAVVGWRAQATIDNT